MNLIREIMERPRPHTRVKIGRNVALVATSVYSLTRAVAYAPGLAGGQLTEPVALISLEGHLLWAWAAAWAIAAILCIADMFEGHTRRGLSFTVGLAIAWGFGYGLSWAVYGFAFDRWTDWWVTAVNYVTVPAIIAGLLYKVTALHDMAHPAGMEENQGGDGCGEQKPSSPQPAQ
jgi:hypothetical protein